MLQAYTSQDPYNYFLGKQLGVLFVVCVCTGDNICLVLKSGVVVKVNHDKWYNEWVSLSFPANNKSNNLFAVKQFAKPLLPDMLHFIHFLINVVKGICIFLWNSL